MKTEVFRKTLFEEEGFTLLEMLISLSLFAFGLLGVATMQTSGILGTATAKWHTESSARATTQIEEIITLPYDDPKLAPTCPHTCVPNNPQGDLYDKLYKDPNGDPYDPYNDPNIHGPIFTKGKYGITWEVFADKPITNTKTIEITVIWKVRETKRKTNYTYYKADH